MKEIRFENTFAPNCRAKTFTIEGIVTAIKLGFLKIDSLPDEIKKEADNKLK